ncbi:MAG TPA: hypothetical protein VKU01_11835 [Bryobacteraceae bacterium]|nr:hypothetical protein [Bryobacteraceae bacterium]
MAIRHLAVLSAGFSMVAPALFAGDAKLTEDDRIEILRGLLSEYATVKTYLPRSKKPLPFDSTGKWDKEEWQKIGREFGPAARVGDLIQVTHVSIENDKIVLELNGGMKKKGSWKDHVSIGMGGATTPINTQQNTNAPGGTSLALQFDDGVPPMKASEIKKLLQPVLDFEKHSATENYVETLPAPVQQAIKDKKVIEGMTQEQVLLALGKPRHKERSSSDGTDLEDWVYGDPPGKIMFVTFENSKVTKVKEAYAGLGGSTAAPLPPR